MAGVAVALIALWPSSRSAASPVAELPVPDAAPTAQPPPPSIAPVAAEADLGVFLETVNHELRTPLNAILGFSDLLLQEIDGPLSEERRQSVEVIRESGATLLSLFDDVTELTALMGGQVLRGDESVDLARRCAQVPAVVAGDIELQLTGGDHRLVGDAGRIGRALDETLSCARDHADGGAARAELVGGGRMRRLKVFVPCSERSAAELRRLLSAPGASGGRGRGEGVGPSIAAHVARLHGGDLKIARAPEGLSLELSFSQEPS